MKKLLLCGAAALALSAAPASAETFKWAFQGDVQSLDPHGLNETFTLGYLGNVYEPLAMYDANLQLIPALATEWENIEPTKWRFKLREGVTFHNGNPFTAEDVVFTWKRSLTEGSDLKSFGNKISDIEVVSDHEVVVSTPAPNPILPQELVFLYVMDREWADENGAMEATSPQAGDETATYAAQNANGTGPFRVVERQADVKSVFERNADYWGNDEIKTNITQIEFTPISQAATRVAALISGQVDLVYPVPVQDWARLEEAEGVRPLTGPEARTIFLGMDQSRDTLLYSSVEDTNPFKDIRVRQAFAHAISLDAINDKIMRGAATPSGLMVAPQINGWNGDLNTPYAFDAEKAKALLTEAGYPDGFTVSMDCPNNRYVNDERICQGVVGFLARIGITVDLNAQPKSKYFAKVLSQNGYDTSFYLLGWTPSSIDSHNVINNLIASQDPEKGTGLFNLGNYTNAKVDELVHLIQTETDQGKRQAYIDEVFQIVKDEYGYIPIHQQPLSWGVRDGVEVAQRPDNVLDFRNVVMP